MIRKDKKIVILPAWLLSINRIWIGILFIILMGTLSLSHNKGNAGNPITIEGLYNCTNSIRAEHGQKRLFLSEQLNRAAFHKLVDMEEYGYWAHQNPSTGIMGWEFIDRSGYYYQFAGENLAIGYQTSDKVCEAWKKSSTHLKNMIDPNFQEMGFAFEHVELEGNKSGVLVVQLFATKAGFEKDYQKPPACTTIIDRSLRVISPGCGILGKEEKSFVLFNPRKQPIEITVDREKKPFKLLQKGKYTHVTFDQPFASGSLEIKIQRAKNESKSRSRIAQLKFIVEATSPDQIGSARLSTRFYANIFENGAASQALAMIILIGLAGIGVIAWEKYPKRKKRR